MTNDARLLAKAGSGNARALAGLYDRYAPSLLSFCRYELGSRDLAHEAVSQTFARAIEALSSGRAPDDLHPWLYGVARSRCQALKPTEPSLDGLQEASAEFVAALDAVPRDERAALVLFELADLTQYEISRVIGVPESQVRVLIWHARAALAGDVEPGEEPECDETRVLLSVGDKPGRRGLRRHLRHCAGCTAFRAAVHAQHAAMRAALAVLPVEGARDEALGAVDLDAARAARSVQRRWRR